MDRTVIHHFKTIDSTSRLAVQMAEQGAAHGTVVHADQQTGGRGRGGRVFQSPVGGLYFSLILRPDIDLQDLPLITLAAGVAISHSLKELTGVQALLKWPNDLFLQGRKLGGILTESGPFSGGTGPDFVVTGVGINLRSQLDLFPSSLRTKVISLYHDRSASVDDDMLLKSLVDAILVSVQRLSGKTDDLLAQWRHLDYLKGRQLEYKSENGVTLATGIGLAPDGRYIIEDDSGESHCIIAGDLNPISLP